MPEYNMYEPERDATAQYTYTFKGWEPALMPVTAAQEYIAQYDSVVNQYTVSFLDWDGTVLQSSKVNYGETPAYVGTTPTRDATAQHTYTFKGWDKEFITVTANQTYKAQYTTTVNKYTVTFIDWDNNVLQKSEVDYGVMPVYNGETPTREGTVSYTYTFKGWEPALTIVTSDQTYKAQYTETINQFTVSFLNWDGSVLQSSQVNYGEKPEYTGETPKRKATAEYTYTFTGWDKELKAVTKAASYTAQYDSVVNHYTVEISITGNGIVTGTEIDDTYVYGTILTLNAIAHEGYRFVKWEDGTTDNPRTIRVTEDMQLEVIFELIPSVGTDLENTHSPMGNTQKILRNGQLIIIRDGVEYNVLGQAL
jgi:Tfp pilus assembly protein PilX